MARQDQGRQGRVTAISLARFVERYTLRDRGLEAVTQAAGVTTLRFDLFHCDDPDHADAAKIYLLDVGFKDDDVRLEGDEGLYSGELSRCEVLDTAFDSGGLHLRLTWRGANTERYAELHLSGNPVFIEETVKCLQAPSGLLRAGREV